MPDRQKLLNTVYEIEAGLWTEEIFSKGSSDQSESIGLQSLFAESPHLPSDALVVTTGKGLQRKQWAFRLDLDDG